MSRSYRVDGPFMDDLPFFPPKQSVIFHGCVKYPEGMMMIYMIYYI